MSLAERVRCPSPSRRDGAPVVDLSADVWWWDSATSEALGSGANTYVRRNSLAVARFETDETALFASVVNSGGQNAIGVMVNGAYHATVNGGAADSTAKDIAIALPAGRKTVELWNGPQLRTGASTFQGTYIRSIRGHIVALPKAQATWRIVVAGDSIACGWNSDSHQNGWLARARRAFSGRIALDAAGSECLIDEAAGSRASRLVALAAGATKREIWLAIGTNDLGRTISAADFGTNYAALVDAIRALDNGLKVYAQSPIWRDGESVVNGAGASLADYRAQIQTIATARSSWCQYVNGLPIVTPANIPDNVHPNDAGHVEFHNVFRATVGY